MVRDARSRERPEPGENPGRAGACALQNEAAAGMSGRQSIGFVGVALVLAALAVAVLLGGCSRKALQDRGAGGSGGSVVIGGRGGIDGGPIITDPPDADHADVVTDVPRPEGGSPDGPPDGPPFTGLRSYTVTAVLQRDGGIGAFPTSHAFTLTLDANRRTWIAGGNAEGKLGVFEPTAAGALHINAVSFQLGGCAGSTVAYTDLTIAIDASDRLTGTGHGRVYIVSGDVGQSVDATMTLTGVRDIQAPTLTMAGNAADPFASFSVTPSEPLAPGATAMLRAADGETIAMTIGGAAGVYVTSFQKPPQVLRYGVQYQIVTDGAADFAGNAATGTGSLIFTTRLAPPLSPEDGFESVTGTSFGGVPVLSGAGAPTITGATSLYIPPSNSPAPTQPVLAVRLALADRETAVRFAYRTVRVSSTIFAPGAAWEIGSIGAGYSVSGLPVDNGATMTAMINGASVTLGPLTTATLPLPAGAANEVVLQRILQVPNAGCSLPIPGVDGIIIDDLRVE